MFGHEKHHTEGLPCGRCLINVNCISGWLSMHRTEIQVQSMPAKILGNTTSYRMLTHFTLPDAYILLLLPAFNLLS